MNPEGPPRPRLRIAWPLVLTVMPALGSLAGGIDGLEPVTIIAFLSSPVFALAAGILLGRQSSQTPGGKFLHGVLWSLGSLAVSLLLQGAGCSLTNFRLGG